MKKKGRLSVDLPRLSIELPKHFPLASLRLGDSGASKASEVDPETRTQSVQRAEERKASFRGSLPPALLEVYDDRDCVAPLEQSEVSVHATALARGADVR